MLPRRVRKRLPDSLDIADRIWREQTYGATSPPSTSNSQPTGGVMNAEPQEQDTTPEEQPRAYTWADEAHIGIPNSERK